MRAQSRSGFASLDLANGNLGIEEVCVVEKEAATSSESKGENAPALFVAGEGFDNVRPTRAKDCCIDVGVGFDDVRVPSVPSVNLGDTGCEIEGACCASGAMMVVDGRVPKAEFQFAEMPARYRPLNLPDAAH